MSDALLKNTFNKISPAYELVADVTVGVATTQVDFSGLNFGKDDDLLLVFDYKASSGLPSLYVNGNNTDTNYYTQRIAVDSTVITGVRYNQPLLCALNANELSMGLVRLKLTNSGYFVFQIENTKSYALSNISLNSLFGSSTFTMSSITSLRIASSVANSIASGSRFQLYRLKAKKVADIIVSSATTQVDITGLSIDKDGEYMLVSDVVGANGAVLNLVANNNTTLTNYYYQNLYADGTAVVSARENKPRLLYVESGNKTFSICKIKLTNNGYYIYQSDISRAYGLSTMQLAKHYGTSTFTMTSITQLSIISEVANAIGIGSRFTLYKMR